MARKTVTETAPETAPETALATTPPAGSNLPAAHIGGEGMEVFTADDVVVPRLKIAQPTSKGIAPKDVGNFIDGLTGTAFDRIEVVFLKLRKTRVLFVKKNDQEPTCGSRDAIVPDTARFDPPQAPACARMEGGRLVAVCPKAVWNRNEVNPEDQRPSCALSYELLGINLTDGGAPFLIALHGTAVRPVRKFLSAVGLRRKNLRDARVTLSLDLVENEQGKFYKPNFGGISWNAPGEFDELFQTWAAYDLDAKPADTSFEFGDNVEGDAPAGGDTEKF